MQKITTISILKRIYLMLRQKFCLHDYAYIKSEFIVGRPHSIFRCKKCHTLRAQKYDYECELR